jgi:hypothetical protein
MSIITTIDTNQIIENFVVDRDYEVRAIFSALPAPGTPTPTPTPTITPSQTPPIAPSQTPPITPSQTPTITPSRSPKIICDEAWVGDTYCDGPNLVRLYRLQDCQEEVRIVQELDQSCQGPPPPSPSPSKSLPAPSPSATPVPTPSVTSTPVATPSVTPSITRSQDLLPSPTPSTSSEFIIPPSSTPTPTTPIFEPVPSSTPINTPTATPTLTPSATPIPTWRSCIDGKLYPEPIPPGYRSAVYVGVGGGICWEPTSEVAIHPNVDDVIFTYMRASGEYPVAQKFTLDNPAYAVYYTVRVLTNSELFDARPAEFQLAPRSTQDFFISIREDVIERFGDGTSLFNLQLEILEIQ